MYEEEGDGFNDEGSLILEEMTVLESCFTNLVPENLNDRDEEDRELETML